MMKRYYFILSMFFAFVLVTNSCKEESAEPLKEAEVLAAYLESADSPYGKDYVNTDMPSIISAEALRTANIAGTIYILDIRSAADFNAGHIENAHNVALADIFTHLETNAATIGDKTIGVVCYTGQTAAFATSLLRLMGYKNAVSMKWGMCSWHSDFDVNRWTAKSITGGSTYVGQFESTSNPKAEKGEMPAISTGKTTGQEILEARVAALLTEGFTPATITAATVFVNPANYYIVNYWPADQYADPGHIPGAIQYTPKETLKLVADLKTLPKDQEIVVYCYTGQTSAFLAAYLRLLGYDAKSLLFGANGMIYNTMLDKGMTCFKATEIKNYDYVGMPPAK